jgi:diapolycopene oxygenase
MQKKAIVIGAGIGGIAAAIRLRKKGYDVCVFEGNAYPGGKLSQFSLGDYRFDAGPSLFTMPNLVDELFVLCGENPRDHFNYSKKEVACNYFWDDGQSFTAWGNQDQFAKEAARVFGESESGLRSYFKKAKFKYDHLSKIFLENSLHKIRTLLNLRTLKALFYSFRYDIFSSLHQTNTTLIRHPKLVQLFDRYATYNGSDPNQTPGLMTLIQHLESHFGTFIPEGGMYQITQSLVALAKRNQVAFVYNTEVEKILVANNSVKGVVAQEKVFEAPLVVCNMDITLAYQKLLPELKIPRAQRLEAPSSAAVIFYWGIKKSYPQLDLHNILFSKDYKKEFDAIFKLQTIDDDPTIYINITSKNVAEDAPSGGENWFVMINTPHDSGQDWLELVKVLRKNCIRKINNLLKEDIEKYIEEEEIRTPKDISRLTRSNKGALYGTSSNNLFAAFLRHPNFSSRAKGLYFCGGSVHPGGGIPLCLWSAKIVSDLAKS